MHNFSALPNFIHFVALNTVVLVMFVFIPKVTTVFSCVISVFHSEAKRECSFALFENTTFSQQFIYTNKVG